MEEALRALLVGFAPLVPLVGNRIYWTDIPQGVTDDLIVMHRISGAPSMHMGGPSELETARIQINTRAGTIAKAWAIRRAIKTCLSGFRGLQGDIAFQGIFLEDEGELPTDDPVGPSIYRGTRSDFTVWSKPA